MSAVFAYVTAGSPEDADRLARTIVAERLAACANVIPGMRSVYWWQGKLEQGEEAVLILKTRTDLVEAATAAVKAAHSYSTPCVLPLTLGQGGNPDYIAWLLAETKE